ncbi:MAG: ABC transporter permease [Caldilineaceae bacterium]|nr:ABC transporter permease [Caldilineaceae bacterium]MBP8109276.1 ABC transporter permease [Caldilineaceae bacterium]MBP8123893.1 ABC transporter permease [Caldilineaceae bacterium]MBP9071822.1 ABC transporter permease [Caldilineaceae bacterium]
MSTTAIHPKENARLEEDLAQRGLLSDAMNRFRRNKLAMFGLAIVTLLVFAALFANIIAPYPFDVANISEALRYPSADHWLGTDEVGRDVYSRIIYGARISLLVGLSAQAIALLIGVPLGLAAGLLGGKVDWLVMRLVEIMTALPALLIALLLISIFGGGLSNVIIAIGLVAWIDACRLLRAQLLSLRERDFILAARATGVKNMRIAIRHLLPNAVAPLIVAITIGIPTAIFTEAGLSFLGLGVNDPIPSWGKMVGGALPYMRVYWYLGVFPTLAIALTMLGFTFVGDGLRDAFDTASGE